ALLCLAHLRSRDHFHGLGDLLGVLDALDLAANFLAGRHDRAPCLMRSGQGAPVQANDFLNDWIAPCSSASASLSIALASSSFFSSAACEVFRNWCRPCSNASTFLVSTSSRKPLFTA